MVTAQQISQSNQVLGNHVQHLAKHPQDFLALVSMNTELAQRYAEAFSAGHVITLLAVAQEKGLSLLTEMLNIIKKGTPVNETFAPYHDQKFPIPDDQKEIESLLQEIAHLITVEYVYDDWYYETVYRVCCAGVTIHEAFDHNYRPYSNSGYRQMSGYQFDIQRKNLIDLKSKNEVFLSFAKDQISSMCRIALNIRARKKLNQLETERIVREKAACAQVISEHKCRLTTIASTLLSKLDSNVFLVDKAGKRVGVLDAEFKPASTFSKIFLSRQCSWNLIDSLIAFKNYPMIGKVISLLSPPVAIRELQKPREGNTDALSIVIANIPNEPQAAEHVLDRMRALPKKMFETAISAFNYDVLLRFEYQSKKLAASFYALSPAFMQKQYPITAVDYVRDLPPPFQPQPAHNPAVVKSRTT
ncbi:MAG: hypothetical protein ACHQAX_07125 [Gammaproteobacteria bacterium]